MSKIVKSKEEGIYFKNLDALRYIAALMVFLQHGVRPAFNALHIDNFWFQRFVETVMSGGFGVSIFFVLSGFLITYLLLSEYDLKGEISLKNFYLRRILRIWPLYFAVVIYAFFIYPSLKTWLGVNQPLGSNVWYQLTFLANFDVINIQNNCLGSDAMSQNITWSVAIEEQFYVFWPLLFVLLPKKMWLAAIVSVMMASLYFRLINHHDNVDLYFHTFAVLIDLAMGGMFALLAKRNKSFLSFFEDASPATLIIIPLATFLLLFFGKDIFDFTYGTAISRMFYTFSFAAFIASQAFIKSNNGFQLKKIPVISRLGKYTYGIYLLHPIALNLLDVVIRLAHLNKENFYVLLMVGIAGYIGTLFLSKISYRFYESRFLKLKEKFTIVKST